MLTKKQLGIIHGLKNKLGLSDEIYRSVLRVVGKVESSKDLSQGKFLPVLAALEDAGNDESFYWRQRLDREQPATAGRPTMANERMIWKIKRLYNEYILKAAECNVPVDRRYQLAGLVANISNNRTREVEQIESREAWQLIEQLKAILSRLDNPVPPPTANILASSPGLFPTQSSALSPQHSIDPEPDYDTPDPDPSPDEGDLVPVGANRIPMCVNEEDIPF
jgi:hypothetical protein